MVMIDTERLEYFCGLQLKTTERTYVTAVNGYRPFQPPSYRYRPHPKNINQALVSIIQNRFSVPWMQLKILCQLLSEFCKKKIWLFNTQQWQMCKRCFFWTWVGRFDSWAFGEEEIRRIIEGKLSYRWSSCSLLSPLLIVSALGQWLTVHYHKGKKNIINVNVFQNPSDSSLISNSPSRISAAGRLCPLLCCRLRADATCVSNWTCYFGEFEGPAHVCLSHKAPAFLEDEVCFLWLGTGKREEKVDTKIWGIVFELFTCVVC